jgi:N-carbamoylputrescine amidase
MTDFVIALCQLASAGLDTRANLQRALSACSEAAGGGADVILLPEMWQIGYSACPSELSSRARWQNMAIGTDDPWVTTLSDAARDLHVAIVVTFLEQWPEAPRNTALLFDRRGEPVLRYAKVHTVDFSMESALTPGPGFEVRTLDTSKGPIQVGMMICHDREFPESARELMLAGAELVLVPNACEMTEDRIGQLRARAFENMFAVALTNYSAPEQNGNSCAFDGIACEPDGTTARNHEIVRADSEENIVYARFDLDLLRRYRATGTWGDAYRKPYSYKEISSVREPMPIFRRSDSRRSRPPIYDSTLTNQK